MRRRTQSGYARVGGRQPSLDPDSPYLRGFTGRQGVECPACNGSGRLPMSNDPDEVRRGRSAWWPDDPICPGCDGEGMV